MVVVLSIIVVTSAIIALNWRFRIMTKQLEHRLSPEMQGDR